MLTIFVLIKKMADPKSLISTLKEQHRLLQVGLSSALEKSNSEDGERCEGVAYILSTFRSNLAKHLDLENRVFYPDYLRRKTNRGEEVASTREFIKQMDEIGETVMGFLDAYNSSKVIETKIVDFKKELLAVIDVLNTRIETEEEGVFDVYLQL